jgi:hypothetical protein
MGVAGILGRAKNDKDQPINFFPLQQLQRLVFPFDFAAL